MPNFDHQRFGDQIIKGAAQASLATSRKLARAKESPAPIIL